MSSLKKRIKNNPIGRYVVERRKSERAYRTYQKKSDIDQIRETYFRETGREPNLSDPKRYTEKLQWLKLFWRDEKATICANKYTVKGYLTDLGYGYLLNETIAYYTDVKQINIAELPNKFVLKGTHGSGWNLIVRDKNKINWSAWKMVMKCWLKQDLTWYGREWVYHDQPHGIIVEKYLEDDSGELRDFKIICTNGIPQFMQIDENRQTNHKRIYVDRDGNEIPMDDNQESRHPTITFGENQREMFRLAEELSKPFPNVRIDFYECNGRIYFGEFTFFGGSGYYSFEPDEWDVHWGSRLILPPANYNLDLYGELCDEYKETERSIH